MVGTRPRLSGKMGIIGVLMKLLKAIAELTLAIKANTKALRVKRPGLVFLKLTKEVNNMLFFELDLPASTTQDVLVGGKRKLSVKVGSADAVDLELSGDAIVSLELSGNDNDVVEGSLVDIDDAGNPSDPSNFSFVLLDTIAPAAPGQVGLRVTREE